MLKLGKSMDAYTAGFDSDKFLTVGSRNIDFMFGLDLSLYYWIPGDLWNDQVSKNPITITDLAAGRYNVNGDLIGLNELNKNRDNSINVGPGEFIQLCQDSEDPGEWALLSGATRSLVGVPVGDFLEYDIIDAGSGADVVGVWIEGDSGNPSGVLYFSIRYNPGSSGEIRVYARDNAESTTSVYAGVIDHAVITQQLAGAFEIFSDEYDSDLGYYIIKGSIDLNTKTNASSFIGIGPNSSDNSNIKVLGADVSESKYILDIHVPSSGSNVAVPSNSGSATKGYSYEIKDDLLDAFDGEADGVELYAQSNAVADANGTETNSTTGFSVGGSLAVLQSQDSVVSVGSYAIEANANSAPSSGARAVDNLGLVEGDRVKLSVDIRHIGSAVGTGQWTAYIGLSSTVNKIIAVIEKTDTVFTTYSVNFVYTAGTYTDIGFKETNAENDGGVYFDNIIVQKLATAQGILVIPELTFMFDAADISGTINIISADDDADSFIRYNATAEQFEMYDGTNTATVTYTAVNGISCKLIAEWGIDGTPKMRLTVNTTVGSQSTFAEIIPNDTDMKFGFNNEEWFKLGVNPYILKEVTW